MIRMRETKWDSLTNLNLGIFDFIKTEIRLEIGAASIFRGSASLKYTTLAYVKIVANRLQ